MKPPKRIEGETARAYEAFLAYLNTGNGRSLARLADGPPRRRLKSLKTWSARFNWQDRVATYEAEQLANAMKGREVALERLRQKFIENAPRALEVFLDLMEGVAPERAQTIPVQNRDGQTIGHKLRVSASNIREVCAGVLDRAGLTVPRRVELSGPDGRELQIGIRAAIGTLSEDQIRALLEHFPEDDE